MRVATHLITAFGLLALPGVSFGGARDNAARDPAQIEFEGIESFDVQSVRRALATDVPMQAASHPRAPTEEYLRTLEQRLRAGYRDAGYLKAKLNARYDEATGQISVRVEEGKQFRCGTIDVSGIDSQEAEGLKRALTDPFPPWDAVPVTITAADGTEQTIWETSQGEPAPLGEPLWAAGAAVRWGWPDIAQRIRQHLVATGRHKAEFRYGAVPDQDDGTARLVVKFEDPGPVSTVAEIVVEGARRHTPEEIKQFLGLREGMEISGRKSSLWEHRLWSSGRFVSAYVRVRNAKSAPDDGSRWDVLVYLKEDPTVPLLTEPLSSEDKLLLKARDWLARQGAIRPAEDVIVEAEWSPQGSFLSRWFRRKIDVRARLVCGVSRGQIVSWGISHAAVEPGFSETLILRDPRITFFAPERSVRFEFDRPEASQLNLRLRAYACDPKKIKPGESKFGCSFDLKGGSASNPAERSLGTRIGIDPVVALTWPRMQGCKGSRQDGRLLLSSKTVHAELDEQTGRIIQLRFDNEKVGLSLVVRTAAGAVAAELERQDQLLLTSLNVFDVDRPLDSAALFLANEWSRFAEAELSGSTRKSAAALRKLLSLWTPDPIGEVVRPLWPDEGPRTFEIPRTDRGQHAKGLKFLVLACNNFLLPVYNQVAPQHAPSWSLGRDALLTAVAHRSGLIDQQSLQAGCGPIGHLAAASALRDIDPAQAALVARSGLEHLSGAEFRGEYAVLLSRETWLGRNLLSLAAAARQLERGEIRALLRPVPRQFFRDAIVDTLLQLASDPQRPLPAALAAALDRLWERTLRAQVAARLNEIAEKTRDHAPQLIPESKIQQVSGKQP